MIRFEQVSKSFATYRGTQPTTALHEISLEVAPGSIFGIIGRSGAGKSTLIRLVNRLEQPSGGRVVVDGQDITALDGAALRAARRRIGMIFQHFNLLSSRTVADNVALPLELPASEGRDRGSASTSCWTWSAWPTSATAIRRSSPAGRSSASASPARWPAGRQVLLSDEATSALDPETTRSILDLLRAINRRVRPDHPADHARDGGDHAVCDQVACSTPAGWSRRGRWLRCFMPAAQHATTQPCSPTADRRQRAADSLTRSFAARRTRQRPLAALRLHRRRSGDAVIGRLVATLRHRSQHRARPASTRCRPGLRSARWCSRCGAAGEQCQAIARRSSAR